jgi:hypothetical protein
VQNTSITLQASTGVLPFSLFKQSEFSFFPTRCSTKIKTKVNLVFSYTLQLKDKNKSQFGCFLHATAQRSSSLARFT